MTTEHTQMPALGDTPAAKEKVKAGFLVTFFLANLGLWMATMTPIIVTLPLKVAAINPDPATQAITLSIVLLAGAVVGIIANPVAGRISDRTTWRLGMRRPWLLIGAALVVVGMLTVGLANAVPLLVLGWVLNQIGVNTMMSVLIALLPDHVPADRRGMVSGILGVGQAVAAMAGTALAFALSRQSLQLALLVPAIIAFVFIVIACIVIKDRHLTKAERPAFDAKAFFRSFWVNPRRYPDFGWAWWSRFAVFMAISMVLNYQLYFLVAQVGLSPDQATAVIPGATAVQTILIVIVSLVFGPLSDRLRRRKVFVLASALILAAGLGIAATATTIPAFLLAMGLVGIGQGVYLAVDLALVTDILPNRERDAAKNIGVFNLASLIPQSLAPAIAPVFLLITFLSITGAQGQNYTMLFIGGTLFAIVSGLLILKVRGVR